MKFVSQYYHTSYFQKEPSVFHFHLFLKDLVPLDPKVLFLVHLKYLHVVADIVEGSVLPSGHTAAVLFVTAASLPKNDINRSSNKTFKTFYHNFYNF